MSDGDAVIPTWIDLFGSLLLSGRFNNIDWDFRFIDTFVIQHY